MHVLEKGLSMSVGSPPEMPLMTLQSDIPPFRDTGTRTCPIQESLTYRRQIEQKSKS